MVFSDSVFLFIFLPVTLIIYYLVPKAWKNSVLFVSGVVFYAWGEPLYVLVMLFSIAVDYFAGLIIAKYGDRRGIKKAALLTAIIVNVGLLGVFKYAGFFVESVNALTGLHLTNPNLPLPIGISFFTFQAMSYVIDLYRGEVEVQKSFVSFAAFVTMFPQIVAGPIVRYNEIAEKLRDRRLTLTQFSEGVSLFITGLGKKVLLANSVGQLWTIVKASDYHSLPAADAWLGIIAFTVQIYFDFSGYSDMAVGMGKMLGFEFPKNFDYPYESKSVSEFWRRWHITLGSWFKSYVYFPMGGSRKGKVRTVFNMLTVWALTGLWHGANINFVIWGLYYWLLLTGERLVYKKLLDRSPKAVKTVYTLLAVMLGWVIFEITAPAEQFSFILALFGSSGHFAARTTLNYIHTYLFTIIAAAIGSTHLPAMLCRKAKERLNTFGEIAEVIVKAFIFILCVSYLVDADYNPFLYFNF